MRKLQRLWQALERVPGLSAVPSEWRDLLGDEFDAASTLLKPNGKYASSYPCPNDCGCSHEVIVHAPDDIKAVCRCEPKRCDTISLTQADTVIYKVDRTALGTAIAKALGATPENSMVDGLPMTALIGNYSPSPAFRFPVYLTVHMETEEFRQVVNALIAKNDKPFILLSPTHDHCESGSLALLRKRNAAFLSLEDVLIWNGDGKLSLEHPLDEILSEFHASVLPPMKEERVFEKQGQTWLLVYDGITKSVRHSIGMEYIAYLLQTQGTEIHASTLRSAVAGEKDTPELGSAGEILDDQALKEYRERLQEVEDEVKEAEANSDLGRTQTLKEEMEFITAEIGRATGLGGKKREASDDRERARQAVSVAIHRALKAIEKEHKPLWQYLRNSLKIGEFLSYSPDLQTDWILK